MMSMPFRTARKERPAIRVLSLTDKRSSRQLRSFGSPGRLHVSCTSLHLRTAGLEGLLGPPGSDDAVSWLVDLAEPLGPEISRSAATDERHGAAHLGLEEI